MPNSRIHRGAIVFLTVLAAACQARPKADKPREINGQETHGGDRIASAFVAKGYRIFDYLTSLAPEEALLAQAEMDLFWGALQSTRVDPIDGPIMDSKGDAIDARTMEDPLQPGKKLIQLDRARWEDALGRGTNVYRLVFHEYLWAIGVDDENYKFSNRLHLFDIPLGGEGSWTSIAEVDAPSFDMTRRSFDVAAEMTKSSLVLIQADIQTCRQAQASTFDLAANTWTRLDLASSSPIGTGFSSVAIGDDVFAWGGVCNHKTASQPELLASGFLVDAAAKTWRAVNPAGAPEGRRQALAIATDAEVLLWGGITAFGPTNTGAIYDPALDSWRAVSSEGAPSAGTYGGTFVPAAVGGALAGKVVIWKSDQDACAPSVVIYDLAADSWTKLETGEAPPYPCNWRRAVWAGGSVAFVFDFAQRRADGTSIAGTMWNVAEDKWTDIAATGAPGYREAASVVWADEKLIVFGGKSVDQLPLNTGKFYRPATGAWQSLRFDEATPLARTGHAAFWTGGAMLIWGGRSIVDKPMRSGALWAPEP